MPRGAACFEFLYQPPELSGLCFLHCLHTLVGPPCLKQVSRLSWRTFMSFANLVFAEAWPTAVLSALFPALPITNITVPSLYVFHVSDTLMQGIQY